MLKKPEISFKQSRVCFCKAHKICCTDYSLPYLNSSYINNFQINPYVRIYFQSYSDPWRSLVVISTLTRSKFFCVTLDPKLPWYYTGVNCKPSGCNFIKSQSTILRQLIRVSNWVLSLRHFKLTALKFNVSVAKTKIKQSNFSWCHIDCIKFPPEKLCM